MDEVVLKAKHFKDTAYDDVKCGCAIEKAVMEVTELPIEGIGEYQFYIKINGRRYNHERYSRNDFYKDRFRAAASHNYDDTVIRTIKLTKVK